MIVKTLPSIYLIISTMVTTLLMTQHVQAHEYAAQMKAKKYAEVERAANTKLLADPSNPDALIVKTELILVEGKESRLDEGSKLAEQCISAHPKNSECHEALGNVLGTKAMRGGMMSAMRYASTIRNSFLTAVELDPKNYSARASLLQYYLQAPAIAGGGKDHAQALIAQSAQISNTAGTLLQASFDMNEDRSAQAETTALSVNSAGSESLVELQFGVLVSLGHRYIREKKYPDSTRLFRLISQRYPERSEGAYGMGRTLQEQGRQKEAIPYFETVVSTDASAYAYYRIGQCFQASSEKFKAIAAFEKALIFKPELPKKMRADVQDQLKVLKG
jgi:tetratricopeptide (TPR) repeat protein